MTASWGDLFDRAAAYDVDRERIRAANETLEPNAESTEGDDG